MEKILTVNDVAAILQVKAITVREMFREQRIRGFKVGKAWRTTETMLQEDIAALARGEAPAVLTAPRETSTAAPAPPVVSPAPAPVSPPAKPSPAAAPPATAVAPDSDAAAAAKARPPRKAPTSPEADTPADDTQQLLF
jgi:excisionase family DNA binding protein